MKKRFNFNKWSRKTHYWGSIIIILPILIVIVSGILVQLKKVDECIQPTTKKGQV